MTQKEKQTHKDRFKVLEQQKLQLEANLYKVIGAMELCTALMEEEKTDTNGLPNTKEKKESGTKKVKH